jgi:hypothetical protein
MKTIKQSRLDRLARRKKRSERIKEAEKKLTKEDRIKRDNAFLKKLKTAVIREGMNKCPHGFAFSGYECVVCRGDEIASRLRNEWRPVDRYELEIIPVDTDAMYIPVTVRTNTLTKTIKEMQENGFWYGLHHSPMFLMPQSIRCVVVKGMAQSLSNTDPPVRPSTSKGEQQKFAQISSPRP